MFLDCFALGLLIFVAIVIFTGSSRSTTFPMKSPSTAITPNSLIRFNDAQQSGRIVVTIRITDPALAEYDLPVGMYGQAAILTEHFHHIGTLRRILLRMAAWMNYIFPLH